MPIKKSSLDGVFDSFIFNDIRILSSPTIQQRMWVDVIGPEVGEFEEDIAYALGSAEDLQRRANELSEERQEYLGVVKELHDKLKVFYDNVICAHPNEEVNYFIELSEWLEIQRIAATLYHEIRETPWYEETDS